MEEDADDVREEDSADVGAVLWGGGDEVRFWGQKDHLVEGAEKEPEE